MQIVIYTAVITFTIVLTAYLALRAGAFVFAYVMYCIGNNMVGEKVSFRKFWKEILPYPGGKPKTEEGK